MSNTVKLALTLVLAITTGVLTYLWLQNVKVEQSSFGVYRLRTDIVGNQTEFSSEVVEVVRFPEDYRGMMGGVAVEASPATAAALRGTVFTRDVPAGSLLLYEYLDTDPEGELSSKLAAGKRAVTIPVNAPATVGYFVEPGSLVDVLGTILKPGDGADPNALAVGGSVQMATLTLLQAVRVLAVGRADDPRAYRRMADRGYTTVTIEVTPAEAEMLVFAMQQVQGGLTLALRNPADDAKVETPSVDWTVWQRTNSVGSTQ